MKVVQNLLNRDGLLAPICIRLCQIGQDVPNLHFEGGQITLHDFPDKFRIGFEIAMNQHMPHSNHAAPSNFGIFLTQFIRNARCRFADNLQVMDNPDFQQFTLPTSNLPIFILNVSFNVMDGFQHVVQAFAVISHKSTASAKTRSRIRFRIPFSVTTSTSVPSKERIS